MATFTTSSGLADLDGTCEIVGDDCTSYTSDNLGAASNIKNFGTGSSLMFQLDFPGPGNIYVINATPNAYGGFSGTVGGNGGTEPWSAGASAQEAVAGKS